MRRYPHYLSGLGETPIDVMDAGEKAVGFGAAGVGLLALGSLFVGNRTATMATAGLAGALGLASLVLSGIKLSLANHETGLVAKNATSAAFADLGFGAGALTASTLALLGVRGS